MFVIEFFFIIILKLDWKNVSGCVYSGLILNWIKKKLFSRVSYAYKFVFQFLLVFAIFQLDLNEIWCISRWRGCFRYLIGKENDLFLRISSQTLRKIKWFFLYYSLKYFIEYIKKEIWRRYFRKKFAAWWKGTERGEANRSSLAVSAHKFTYWWGIEIIALKDNSSII